MSRVLAGGVGDYLQGVNQPEYDALTGDFTAAIFGKLDPATSGARVMMVKAPTGLVNYDIIMYLEVDGRFAFYSKWPSGVGANVVSSTAITDTNWHHYAVTYNATSAAVTLYVDGNSAGTGPMATFGATATAEILLGRSDLSFGVPWKGLLSQMHLFNTTLTQANVQAIRISPNSIITGSIGYWALQSATATPEPDLSTVNNDLVVGTTTHSAVEPSVAPAAPTSLVGTAGDNTVGLTWTVSATSGVTEQRVYRRLSAGAYSTAFTPALGPAVTSYTDNSATNGSDYYYMVRAYNGVESADSNETATMQPISGTALPLAPTNVVASAGVSSVALTWTVSVSSGVVQQRIYRSTTPGVYTTALPAASALSNVANSFTDSTASNGTTYYYVIRSFTTVESANSTQVSATPASGAQPAPPTNFVATAGDNMVSFFWSRSLSAGITQQRIYRTQVSGTYGASGTQLITIADNVTQISQDVTAVNGQAYYYTMRTYNGTLESLPSTEQGPVTPSVDAPPLPPTNLTGTSGNGRIFLTWTPSITPGVTTQLVYRSLASGVYGAALTTINDNVTSVYTDLTPQNDVPYFYVVRAAY